MASGNIILKRVSGPTLERQMPSIILQRKAYSAPAATQAEAEAGTEVALRLFSPLRIAQSIAALGASIAAVALNTAHRLLTNNPHAVTDQQVSPTIYNNGPLGVDTEIDWANGSVQTITVSAIINVTFTGWQALPKASAGTLIIIDGDLYNPTWSTLNQGGSAPDYASGFATWLELASLEGGDIYNMWQVSNDQYVLLDDDSVANGDFANWTGDDPDDWSVTEVGDATSNVTEGAGGGSCRIISNGTSTNITQAGTLVSGGAYLYSIDIKDVTSGKVKLTDGLGTILDNINTTGIKTGIFTSTGTAIGVSRSGACDITIDDLSIRRLY